jgi:hypothetical protein
VGTVATETDGRGLAPRRVTGGDLCAAPHVPEVGPFQLLAHGNLKSRTKLLPELSIERQLGPISNVPMVSAEISRHQTVESGVLPLCE